MTIEHKIDRTGWEPGPWDSEPEDRIEWRDEATGLPCLMVRNSAGAWCGYVGVPPDHPFHGVDYCGKTDEDGTYRCSPVTDLECHGGITYAAGCAGAICHVPAPHEPDNVWWLGFDCAHYGDVRPGDEAAYRRIGLQPARYPFATYRHREYVRAEVAKLAAQIAEAA